ncbi:MAG TPA: AraC family transcriptional regulator [Chryseolinea sp.]|nr:AraC family transcriptional regulator [Chryseolinea sp.]
MKQGKNQNIKYLTVNAADELWGLYTTTLGHQTISPNTNYPPKGHPSAYWFAPNTGRVLHEYILLYITKGEGFFESASCKTVKVQAGTMILLFPEEWHTYKPGKNAGWNEYWIGFNGDYIRKLISNGFFRKTHPLFDVGFNEQIVGLFNLGIETANFQKTAYQQVLAGITSLLLGSIFYSEKNNSFRDKAIISQIDKARMMMRENPGSNIHPESIAKSLNLSYSWFRRVFKQYTGFSPAQYQMEIKVQKSKELLTSTSMLVKEIAFDLDFESVSYFVTFFKSKTGMSPVEYRNKVKGKKE